MTIADQIAQAHCSLNEARREVRAIHERMDHNEAALASLDRVVGDLRSAMHHLLMARTVWVADHPVQDPDQLSLIEVAG